MEYGKWYEIDNKINRRDEFVMKVTSGWLYLMEHDALDSVTSTFIPDEEHMMEHDQWNLLNDN